MLAKKFNKRLIGFIIGGTILGLTGLSSTKQGRGVIGRFIYRFRGIARSSLQTAQRRGERLGKK